MIIIAMSLIKEVMIQRCRYGKSKSENFELQINVIVLGDKIYHTSKIVGYFPFMNPVVLDCKENSSILC